MINKKTPNIGFSVHESILKKLSFEKIFDRVKSYSLSRSVESNSETGTKYIHYGDIHTKVADKVDRASNIPYIVPGDYETLQKGDLILADASEDYQGIATPAVIIDETPFNIVAGLHTIALRPKKADSLYLYYLLKSSSFRKYGYRTGTGMKVFGISVTNVLKFDYLYPDIQEQQKIGEFFKQLDDRIALQQNHIEQLKQSKQGFLQKMFPKDGELVPEVRFEGFSGEWKKRKMKSILIERNEQITESNEYPLMSFVQEKGVTPKSERYDRGFLVKNSDKKYKKTEYGDFIYSSNNLETGSIGFNRTGKAVISPVYSIFYSNNNIESQFIGILSMQKLFVNKMIRYRQGVVYGQWRIHEKDFLNISMRIPDLQEQQKIGEFFKQLDDLIAKNECELELLQETKKGFLQKMFV